MTSGSNLMLSEIRILLLGGRELFGRHKSGKSTTGNIILGKNAFEVGRRTARSVQAENEVHGRHVTVVDTPSWVWCCSVEQTPHFDRLEIMRSATMCPPGPHAVLLVIPVNSVFRHICRDPLESQLEFLTDKVWRHTIVLFSSVDPLKDKLPEIQDMEWLLNKCKNRYHVLNIKSCEDNFQVISLLEKIEKMVAQNNAQYLQIDKAVSEGDPKMDTRGADQRILTVKTRRAELQACIKDEKKNPTDIRILIIGGAQGAKSSAGNLILGKNVFNVGEARTTVCCATNQGKVHKRKLTVVDTPGWYYNYPLEKTLEMDKLEIRRSVYLCPPGPHAILLTIPIIVAYDKTVHTAVEEHMSLLGKNVWKHTIVLFTWGDWLGDTTIEERIEKEDKHLELLIEKCENRYHVFNSKNHTDRTQVTDLLKKIEEMIVENNGSHYEPEMESNPSLDFDLILKKARTSMTKMNRQTCIIQDLLKEIQFSELRIVLLGVEGIEKGAPGNILLQGDSLRMPKEVFKTPTRQCVMKQSKVGRCRVSVVDTPGWSTSTQNAREILNSLTVSSPGPHGFMLVLPVNEALTKKNERTVIELMGLFGERVWRHTLIFFSCAKWLNNRPVEQFIACEGEALQRLLRKCGNRYFVPISCCMLGDLCTSIGGNLLKAIQVMVARNRGEYFTLENEESNLMTTSSQLLTRSKMLTEEEWNRREDELIKRMLKAAVVDLNAESKEPCLRQGTTLDQLNSTYCLSDIASSSETDTLNRSDMVSHWLLHAEKEATSEYITLTIIRMTEDQNTEDVEDDIPKPRSHSFDMGTLKNVSDVKEKKHSRSFSI